MSRQRPEDRLATVRELHQYRLPPEVIATAVGCSRGTVVHDLAVLRHRGELPRRLAEGPTFQRALRRFAELSMESGTRGSRTASNIYQALRSSLGIDVIIEQLTGAAAALERIRDPATDPRERGAANLIARIFGATSVRGLPHRAHEQRPDARTIAREYVSVFLTAVTYGQREIPGTIESFKDLKALLLNEFLERHRAMVRLPWPPEALELVDAAIDTLPIERDREVIRLRYGIRDGCIRTLKQVGVACGGKSVGRMQQREAKALRYLRHPSRAKNLRLLAGTFSELAAEAIRRELPARTDRQRAPRRDARTDPELYDPFLVDIRRRACAQSPLYNDGLTRLLRMRLDEFEFSVRVTNGLAHMGIETIADLVQVDRKFLLGAKNLGELSLREIEEFLDALGLRLGLKLHDRLRTLLALR